MPDIGLAGLSNLRARIAALRLAEEAPLVAELADRAAPASAAGVAEAAALVRHLRDHARPGLMETFLAEYGLSTEEGVALMCLAEALLRVPDADTADALIRDKIAGADWARHLGQSSSPLVNASTWALMLTGRVIGGAEEADVAGAARRLVRRLGEPVLRLAVGRAMRVLGGQFVLGTDIADAMDNARTAERAGFTHSYDMLGEAARTAEDAARYQRSYAEAIGAIAARCEGADVRVNPGISVKLSALHPRYETSQRDRVMAELVPRVAALARQARASGMGFNVDAEEADRLDISLDVIEAALRDPTLAGWDGFGVVVQAYGKRAMPVIEWLHALAVQLDRRLMVRLVKGAYWDTEVKRAQTLGEAGYPVFTRKAHTDVSYLACARRLLELTDRIYPQFATHNAHTITAILAVGDSGNYEFQRLHGMGEALHAEVMRRHGTRCRIYAPVGVHEDLLAYLVRRLLENGANSSFVHRVLDRSVPVGAVVADPAAAARQDGFRPHPRIPAPPDLYGPARRNSRGWNLDDPATADALDAAMAPWRAHRWSTGGVAIRNPADPDDVVGHVDWADAKAARSALDDAHAAFSAWFARHVQERAALLRRAAEAYEAHAPELMALAVREAGKNRADAVAELREAVDFLRYYAAEAAGGLAGRAARGPFVCISPWNFPLAIFTGQVAAALVAGNTVLAKPAEQTPLIAARAVELLHGAGIPRAVLHLLPGDGPTLGQALLTDARVAGVAFTGSTATAKAIDRAMAAHLDPFAPLIAETGGVNAMIVDSTALPEQVVRDALASAFQSSGQRCSALRLLVVQDDVAPRVTAMLAGALAELRAGDPWDRATDLGPVIDAESRARIAAHVARHAARIVAQLPVPERGLFVPPTILRLDRIEELTEEVFGPVLHVVACPAEALDDAVGRINALGYGLTMGLHTRLDDRVERVVAAARVGNLYVNRNQIGAVVGVQPFGGERLSGTGPKAGGPLYLHRFTAPVAPVQATDVLDRAGPLPGPAGESNRLFLHPRGRVLCLGPDVAAQAALARALGNEPVEGNAADAARADIGAVMAGDGAAAVRRALAERPGPIVPLVGPHPDAVPLVTERTVSVDTTASGGNVALLAAGE